MGLFSGGRKEGIRLEETEIFSRVMMNNNRRLFISFVSIMLLANLATLVILVTGTASKHLSLADIGIELAAVLVILGMTAFWSRRYRGKPVSSYITLSGVMLCLFI